MALNYVNPFDLLGDSETDDVTALSNRMHANSVKQKPISQNKASKSQAVSAGRKAKERERQLEKEREERQRILKKERDEEAKQMTLAEYEKMLQEKKNALAAKKQANGEAPESWETPKGKLKISESVQKEGDKTEAIDLTKIFTPAPLRRSNVGGWGRGGGQSDQGGRLNHAFSSSEAQQSNEAAQFSSETAVKAKETYSSSFPVLGSKN